jgi:Ca2+-transporting ATPase
LQVLLHTTAIGATEWQLILAFALPILVVPEILKAVRLAFQRT